MRSIPILYPKIAETGGDALDKKESSGGAGEVDAYIASFPEKTREKLNEIRAIVKAIAKEAEEGISYGMPAFRLGGPLVYYAGFKKHIGLYPMPSGVESFKEDLLEYAHSKGAIRFPLDEKLPTALIRRIVRFRLTECSKRAKKG
jgi:uncharacterized protein YdhG (YjbR/CyaY superfamily)